MQHRDAHSGCDVLLIFYRQAATLTKEHRLFD